MVTFCNPAVAAAALHLTGTDLAGRALFVSSTLPAGSVPTGYGGSFGQSGLQSCGIISAPFKNPNVTPAIIQCDPIRAEEMSRTIYIGNLPINITEEQLREFLKSVGNLVNMKIAGENTASVTGSGKYAFLEFETQNQAEEALKLNGVVLGDRAIRVNHSRNAIYKPATRPISSMRRQVNCNSTLSSKRPKESFDKGSSSARDSAGAEYSHRTSAVTSSRKSRSHYHSRSPEDSRHQSGEKSGRSYRYKDESPLSKSPRSPDRGSRSYYHRGRHSSSSLSPPSRRSKTRIRSSGDASYKQDDSKYDHSPRDHHSRSRRSCDAEKLRRSRTHGRDSSPGWHSPVAREKSRDYTRKEHGSSSLKYKSSSRGKSYRDHNGDLEKDRAVDIDRDRSRNRKKGSESNRESEKEREKDKDVLKERMVGSENDRGGGEEGGSERESAAKDVKESGSQKKDKERERHGQRDEDMNIDSRKDTERGRGTEENADKGAGKYADSDKYGDRDKSTRGDREKNRSKIRERDKDSSRSRKTSRDGRGERSKSEKSRKRHKESRGHSRERSHEKSRQSDKERDYTREKYRRRD